MSALVNKLFRGFEKKTNSMKCWSDETENFNPMTPRDRDSSKNYDNDYVRAFILRESELKGRQLLLDSFSFNKLKRNKEKYCCHQNFSKSDQIQEHANLPHFALRKGKALKEEDVSFLGDMIFGTVAMTFRGSSFKVHALDSSNCLMCTKIFVYANCANSVETRNETTHSQDSIKTNFTNFDHRKFQRRRSKTRFGLAILLYLSEAKTLDKARLLERAILLESALDRLCHFWQKGAKENSASRLCHAVLLSNVQLTNVILAIDKRENLLIWHNLLLHSIEPVEIKVNQLHRSLQQMHRVIEAFDTKSTNFFISTVVTAALTHHLGWIYSASPTFAQKKSNKNPILNQVNDLFGNLGVPSKIAKTVIVGEPENIHVVQSVLNFLTYFLRSNVARKHAEIPHSIEKDVEESVTRVESEFRKNPTLRQMSSLPESSSRKVPSKIRQTSPEILEEKKFEDLDFEVVKEASGRSKLLEEIANLENFDKNFPEVDVEKFFTTEELDEFYNSAVSSHKRQKLTNENLKFKPNFLESVAFPVSIDYDLSINDRIKSPVLYTVGNEELGNKAPTKSIRERLKSTCKCECSYTFTRIPSSSAELPEGILRKIIQRNFPESTKNLQGRFGCDPDEFSECSQCRKGLAEGQFSSKGFENGKIFLETPTNATEMMRGCGPSTSSKQIDTDSLEALMRANYVVELPMPRSKKVSDPAVEEKADKLVNLAPTLVNTTVGSLESGYSWGVAVQGFTKKRKTEKEDQSWLDQIREDIKLDLKFPLVNQPVSEVLCIVADVDNWQVGLLSSNAATHTSLAPVGMSTLVANMLEAFTFIWKEFESPEQCIKLLENRLRDIWMKSEVLAEYILSTTTNDSKSSEIMKNLQLEDADSSLLLSVATAHTPQVAHKFSFAVA